MPRRFRTQQFFSPDFTRVHDCSLFEYHKHRVSVRVRKRPETGSAGGISRPKTRPHINKVVVHAAVDVCCYCGSHTLKSQSTCKKDAVDLKFCRGGVKMWFERHKARCYKCKQCGRTMYPKEYVALGGGRRGRGKSGDNLDVWCVYNKIALAQSLRQIATGVQDFFGISCHHTTVANAIAKVARKYKSTYVDLTARCKNEFGNPRRRDLGVSHCELEAAGIHMDVYEHG